MDQTKGWGWKTLLFCTVVYKIIKSKAIGL